MEEKKPLADNNNVKAFEQLQKENYAMMEMLREAFAEIKELKRKLCEHESLPEGYNKKWGWITKIAFVVAQADKPLLSYEISATLAALEPDFSKMNDPEKFLSSVLNTAMKYGRFVRYKLKGTRGNFYCLPDWIDNNGQLVQDYRKKVF